MTTPPPLPRATTNQFWETTDSNGQTVLTSGGSTFFTSGSSTFFTSGGSSIATTFHSGSSGAVPTSAGSASSDGASHPSSSGPFPSSQISSHTTSILSTSAAVATASTSLPHASPTAVSNVKGDPVCVGDGIDASAGGLLSVIILPTAVGLILWLLFAFLRPRFRQLYALREWFVQQDLRPKPLGDKPWAFLFPHVPLIPSVQPDTSDYGHSPTQDAELFPADEQLSQRGLFIALWIVAGWSVLALAGALPLYLVKTSCLADSAPQTAPGTGAYSTLQDLSLLRLLQLYDNEHGNPLPSHSLISDRTVHQLAKRTSGITNARIRIIILAILVILLAVLPAVIKILREFRKLVAYRQAWIETRCGGQEMGWLSARVAPGFQGWGEKRLKDLLVRHGLSSGMDGSRSQTRTASRGTGGNERRSASRGGGQRRRSTEEEPLAEKLSDDGPEVDIQGMFTICDTHQLALLIEQRDGILEQLEMAETKYIASFRVSTPDPSIADLLSNAPHDSVNGRPYISRPKPLAGSTAARKRDPPARARSPNPAYGSSSLTPTSYLLPSQYYKLRRVEGVSGGRFSGLAQGSSPRMEMSLSDSFNQRVVGSRFQELPARNSDVYGPAPIGSHVVMDKEGTLGPAAHSPIIPDPSKYGPNFNGPENGDVGDEWVDLSGEHVPVGGDPGGPSNDEADEYGVIPPSARRGPLIWDYRPPSSTVNKRDTFPMRRNADPLTGDEQLPPPHLRLQARGPFVRPISGLDHNDLGNVYGDISYWRSRLKAINDEISRAQSDAYGDIAEGVKIKGWLMVGKGVRFIPGVKMIEGRAKEDVRWDQLQNESTMVEKVIMWSANFLVAVLLAAALLAVAGLALGTAPNVTNWLGFMKPLARRNDWISGLATGLAPAVAGTLFVVMAVFIVHNTSHLGGQVSVTGLELAVFRTTFYILAIIAGIWLMAVGAILFGFEGFQTSGASRAVSNGSLYMSAFALMIVFNVAIISPALLLLQPRHLHRLLKAERDAITPRQRFRALYPRSYNPSYSIGCCVLAIVFASMFALLFPLICPAVVVLLLLTLIAHRYLIGYVYARTHSQTGGLLQIWLLKRFGTVVAFQPILLGLILLTRRLWEEGGVLVGTGIAVIVGVEVYTRRKQRLPGVKSLSPMTQESLVSFSRTAKRPAGDEESSDLVSTDGGPPPIRTRGSMASVLEMMSVTLAVMPSSQRRRGPVPLPTETLDDLTATERAARTHPDAPPHLPALPFADHAEEMSGILYAPELTAPPPMIWLPNDRGGVARSEAYDLQRYHGLPVCLDVLTERDVMSPEQVTAGTGTVRRRSTGRRSSSHSRR